LFLVYECLRAYMHAWKFCMHVFILWVLVQIRDKEYLIYFRDVFFPESYKIKVKISDHFLFPANWRECFASDRYILGFYDEASAKYSYFEPGISLYHLKYCSILNIRQVGMTLFLDILMEYFMCKVRMGLIYSKSNEVDSK
jgi:hypothetical protein